MSQMTNWQLFHRYRHLVDKGVAMPLTCPNCGGYVVTRLDSGDEPMLWCYSDLTSIRPGLDLIAKVRAVVTEHYL